MFEPMVYLYAIKNPKSSSTDEKIVDIVRRHLSEEGIRFSEGPLLIRRTERGKPYIPQLPDLHISVTHSGKWFICGISGQPLGIDLQEHTLLKKETPQQALDRYCKIAYRFFHSEEAAFVEKDPQERFFPVWAAKESYVKYTGQGMDQYFDSFCVLDPSPTAQNRLPDDKVWQAENVFFRQKCFDDTYTFCMCTPVPCLYHWTILDYLAC